MNIHRLLAAGWVLLPLSAMAAQAQAIQAADANVKVPAPAYLSAFKTYRPMAEDSESPDKAWRTANSAVRAEAGHAGQMHHHGQASAHPSMNERDQPNEKTAHANEETHHAH